ncbi:MAG: hypothetical protein JAY66_00005 [Candidatus Thiodiazotropha taylori]|nr:hypothetical protein [Candidatus Thiodiazotropha taylori]
MSEIKEDLQKVYGEAAFSKSCIHKWWHRFSDGRTSTKDDARSGRIVKYTTEENCAAIEQYVMEDRRVTVRNVAEDFNLSYGTAQEILTEKLELSRVCARWVPRLLQPDQKRVRKQICRDILNRYAEEGDGFLNKIITCDETWFHFFEPESKQQSSVWKHASSPSPVKARLSKSVGKVMSIIFCDTKGIVLNHMVPAKTTVNSEYYAHLIKFQLQRAIRDKRPELVRSGFILHQDNAPVHVSQLVTSTLKELGIETLPHPPYSPDLAICDFFLFPNVKDQLRGVKYETRDELGAAITVALREVSRDGLRHAFGTWMNRCQKCIKVKGSYVEK